MTNTPSLSKDTGPLDWRIAIVDKAGRPTPEFQRRWATQRTNNGLIGFVGIGSGMPTGTPAGDGEVYIDISTTPPTLYVADGGNWEVVGVVNFTDLRDVPHAYTASADELVRVKSTTDGLEFASISTVLDTIGSDQGDILYRSATGWVPLSPGTAGWILETTGGASNPQWSDISNILDNLGITQGDVIYRGASGWTVLSPGTSGDVLTTGGSGADPSWTAAAGGATGANPTATASDTVVNGTATTFMRSDAAPPVQIGSSSQFGLFKVDGTTVTESAGVLSATGGGGGGTPANPTATASDVAVNGSATTYMRSDAAPAVQKASSSQFGLVKVDGTTITSSGGVISSSGGGGGGGVWTLLDTITVSSQTEVDVLSVFSSSYEEYEISITEFIPTTSSGNMTFQFGNASGPTWDTTASYYWGQTLAQNGGGGAVQPGASADTSCSIFTTWATVLTPAIPGQANLIIKLPTSSGSKSVYGQVFYHNGSFAAGGSIAALLVTTNSYDSFRLQFANGITSGVLKVYGR